jgi:hypothetical protein
MEPVTLIGLALIGAYLTNNNVADKERIIPDKPINKHEQVEARNIYNTRRLKKLRKDINILAKDKFEKSKDPKQSNIIFPNLYDKMDLDSKDENLRPLQFEDSEDYSDDPVDNDDNIFGDNMALFEKSTQLITDDHYNKYIKDRNEGKGESFTDMFDKPSYDQTGPAGPQNGLNVDAERQLKEGFSVINVNQTGLNDEIDDMDYGVIKDKRDFKHDNMVPFYKGKSYGNNDDKWADNKQTKLDLFSGSSREYKLKTEQPPLFGPVKNLTHTYGMPSTTDFRQSRYYSSLGRERRNETLFQPQRVAPGVNQGYNGQGVDGFQPSYRALEKTIDELRPANRPQITYSMPVKSGFKREVRPVQAPVIKYKPDTFRDELKRNLVKNLSSIRAPTVRDNYFVKETNKELSLREHYGTAGNAEQSVGTNVPINLIPKIKKTNRQVYKHPGISNLGASERFDEGWLNWIQKSFFFPNNERSTTQYNQHLLGAKRGKGNVAYNPETYRAKNTKKELTEHRQHVTNATKLGKGTVAYDPKDVARNTIKQLTEHQQHVTNTGINKGTIAYNPETYRAKNTKKELTEHNEHITNAGRSRGTVTYDPNDVARNTIKQLTEHQQHITNASKNKGTIAFDPKDYRAKNTKKELTEHQQHVTNAGRSRGTVTYDPKDVARNTIKQLTEHQQHVTNASKNKGTIAFDPKDYRAKNTKKELTEHRQHVTNATKSGKGTVAYDPNDVARNTIKQLTEHQQHVTNVSRSKGTVAFDPKDYRAKNTKKELTEHRQHITNATKSGKGTVAYDPNDKARNTIKQLTEHNEHITNAGRSRGTVAYDPKDYRAKNTRKELTEHNEHILGASRGKGTVAYDPKDVARNTIKQLTEHNEHVTNAGRNKGTIAFSPKDYRAKNTRKELTEHNEHILGASRGKGTVAYDPNDKARNTIKELTEHNEHVTNAGRSKGTIAYDPKDVARNTIKELTEHQQHILGASRGKGQVTYDPIEHAARETNRQTTQNTFYVPAAKSRNEAHRPYDDMYNAQLDDCKEQLALSGRAPTTSNYVKGPVADMPSYRLKTPINIEREEVPDCRMMNSLFRMPVNLTQARMTLPQEERRLDEKTLAGLDSNPFSIPSYYNNCGSTLLK